MDASREKKQLGEKGKEVKVEGWREKRFEGSELLKLSEGELGSHLTLGASE